MIVTIKGGAPFVYSIVKTKNQPSGVQYNLTLHIFLDGVPYQVQGFFDEGQPTGMRDSTIYSLFLQQAGPNDGPWQSQGRPWMQDPYDGNTDGWQMNLSELPRFDEMFPYHPLSVVRRFIAQTITPMM